jgi:DNA-binding IclR family transcriptional regulator
MATTRGADGTFENRFDGEAILDVFDEVTGPVVTSADVAEDMDCSNETARRKLRALEDWGYLRSRETAGRIVWWQRE